MSPRNRRRWLRRLLGLALLLVAGLNVVAFLQAWRLTHFTADGGPRTPDPAHLTPAQRLAVLLTGVRNPKPRNDSLPAFTYQTVQLPSPAGRLEAWYAAPAGPVRGVVALFHGYASSKGRLRHEAATFRALGWAVLLVDEPGSGGSAGYRTTIGHDEALAVVAAVGYLRERPGGARRPLVLYGVSMGAAAIMRAEAELGVRPTANILECPFGTMRQTVINRFRAMHVPVFPVADMLVFWGGVQNGFWAYGLNPEEFARRIDTPTLLLWGTADQRVTPAETDSIFAHLAGPKQRVNFAGAGHEPYWHRYPHQWRRVVAGFLGQQVP
ncbi:MAG: alpha/beta hydrolase [Janthinobacterium lividum]